MTLSVVVRPTLHTMTQHDANQQMVRVTYISVALYVILSP